MTEAAGQVRVALLSRPSDGPRYHRLALSAESDRSLRLTSHQMGGSLEAGWGLDDEEIELVISPDQVAVLAVGLVSERLAGAASAVSDLATLCEGRGVAFRPFCWT